VIVLAARGAHHLAGQEDEADVELDAHKASQPLQGVEKDAVAPVEIHGHDVALRGDGLRDDALVPLDVLHASVNIARAQACGECHQLGVGREIGFLHGGHIFALLASDGVDGQEDGTQRTDVHEHVVDNDFQLLALLSEHADVADAVEGAQGMVGHKEITLCEVDVVQPLHVERHVKLFGHAFGKVHALASVQGREYVVHVLLADEPFDGADEPARNLVVMVGNLGAEQFVDVYFLLIFHKLIAKIKLFSLTEGLFRENVLPLRRKRIIRGANPLDFAENIPFLI